MKARLYSKVRYASTIALFETSVDGETNYQFPCLYKNTLLDPLQPFRKADGSRPVMPYFGLSQW